MRVHIKASKTDQARKGTTLQIGAANSLVSFPDPAFKLNKGLAHFARNLGLPDLAGKE